MSITYTNIHVLDFASLHFVICNEKSLSTTLGFSCTLYAIELMNAYRAIYAMHAYMHTTAATALLMHSFVL